jgi:Kef-type K+ transport system membrane component KefB
MAEVLISNILLALVLLIGVARIFGEICERLGLGAVIGELLTGLLLGPSILNWISPHDVESFAVVGSVLILFFAGLKQKHVDDLLRNTSAVVIALAMLVLTFVGIFFAFKGMFTITQIIFIALAYAVVDLGVPAKLLLSKNLLGSPFGQNVLNISVINILVGLLGLTGLTIFFSTSTTDVVLRLAGILGFAVLFTILFWSVNHLSRYIIMMEIEEAQFSVAFVLVLFLAYLSDALGFSTVLGAFLAGVIIAKMGFSGTRDFSEKLGAVGSGIFIPLFFAWFGLELNLGAIIDNIWIALAILVVAVVIKFTVCYVGARMYSLPKPGMTASSMLSLDVESLVILLLAVKISVFDSSFPLDVFAPAVLGSTLLVTILLKVFSKLEKVSYGKARY